MPALSRVPFFYGWVVVAVAFVTMALGVNARTAFSLLFPSILAEFGWERGVTAGAFSAGFVAGTLYTPVAGFLMDRWGPRWVISSSVVVVSAGLGLAPFISRPWHLHATLGVLVGGGSFLLGYTGHALFLPHWFVRRRGLAMGLAFSGVGVGSILILPWLGRMIGAAGWRQACVVLALLLLVTLLPLNLIFPRGRPDELGLAPDGDARPAPGEPRATADNVVDPTWVAVDWTLGRAVRTVRFWAVFACFFAGLFAWYTVQVHQTKYLLDIGFTPEVAAWALALVGLMGIAGQILLGHLSDRVGRERVWTLASLGFVVCYAALLLMRESPTGGLLALVVAAQGLLGYGLASVYGAIPAELFQGRHYGAIFGTLNLASGLGGAAGPWVAGRLHDATGSYEAGFWLAAAFSVVSMAAVWVAAPGKVRAVAGRTPGGQAGPAAPDGR
jgi:MFS family permease